MPRTKKFDLSDYIHSVCEKVGVDPKEDVFKGTDLENSGYSIDYETVLWFAAVLNRDPAFNPRAGEIFKDRKLFEKFLNSNKVSDGILPQPILQRYCSFAKRFFRFGIFVADISHSQQLESDINYVAESDSPVLILGESGTGKELTAKAIHYFSDREEKPFKALNCAQYHDSQLLRSELFGHERGAFTGAIKEHDGILGKVKDGTLFLDEIASTDNNFQTSLLRFLNDRTFIPLGGTKEERSNARVICATNEPHIMGNGMGAVKLRPDLYYRISKHIINLPPLRNHKANIPLIMYLVSKSLLKKNQYEKTIEFPLLLIYDWIRHHEFQGNYRELNNLIEDYVKKYISFKSRDESDTSVLPFVRELGSRRGKRKSKLPESAIHLLTLIGDPSDILENTPSILHGLRYKLEDLKTFPYLSWALFDLDKSEKKAGHNLRDYSRFTTVKTGLPSRLSLEFAKGDVGPSETLRQLASDCTTIDSLLKMYLEEFEKLHEYKSDSDWARKLGYLDSRKLKTLYKGVGLLFPQRGTSKRQT